MKVVTTVDVPDYVYLYFMNEARKYRSKTPEELMMGHLARYVRQKKYREEKKQKEAEK